GPLARPELYRKILNLQNRSFCWASLSFRSYHERSLSLGFRASFKPSPIRLIDSTVRKMAIPGKVTDHQVTRKYGRLLPIIKPQLIILGSPNPRKDKPASKRMA